uniref:hypothetical protein n=1 Tax=Campylobacter ureolyticus TaxID=827 RepID=UPI00288985A8
MTIEGKDTVWGDKVGKTLLSGVDKNKDATLNITNGAKFITKDLHLGLDAFKIVKDPVDYTQEEIDEYKKTHNGWGPRGLKEYGRAEFIDFKSKVIISVIGENSTLKANKIESAITGGKSDKRPHFFKDGTLIGVGDKYKNYKFYEQRDSSNGPDNKEKIYILNLKDGGILEIGEKVNLGISHHGNIAEFNSDGGIVRFTQSNLKEIGVGEEVDLGTKINLGHKGITFDTNGHNVDLGETAFEFINGTTGTRLKKTGKGILRAMKYPYIDDTFLKMYNINDIEADEGVLEVLWLNGVMFPNQTLTIGVRSKDDYGKIKIINSDFYIKNGKMFVNANNAILSVGNILKDVITVESEYYDISGKFSEIDDNNNYVNFEENLEDINSEGRRKSVNLKVVAATAPNPDKPNPDKPNPDKPNP